MKKKILYLNKIGELGGAEVSLEQLVGSLPRSDFAPVVVLGSDGPLRERLAVLKIPVYVFPLDLLHTHNPVPFIKTIGFLRRVIKKEKIDIIHTNTNWDNQYGVIAAKLTGIPHILHVRGFSRSQYSWKSFYGAGSMAICNSKHTRDTFVMFSGFRKRVEVVYNGIDSDVFKPDQEKRAQMRRRYGFGDNDIVMGMAGRLAEEKGQLQLLKALLGRLQNNRNYKIFIAGDAALCPGSEYKERIDAFIADNKLDEQIILAGFVDSMPAFYNALDLFLHPALREPFGRVVVEAMAAERPVIASNIDGIAEIVSASEEDGFLIERADWQAWLRRIDFVISHPDTAARMGRRGREKAVQHFSLAAQMKSIQGIYADLMG